MRMVNDTKNKMMQISRERKLRHFYSVFSDGMTVLDVGVSSDSKTRRSAANYFLKNFPYDPKYYTGLGVHDLSDIKSSYPAMRFIRYPGGTFPFKDDEFDWVFSNAVIEHVGDDSAQLLFVNEMLRVAKNVFFTTPSKYFPVESHTNVLFLHWNNALFYQWCRRRGKPINEKNLYLLSSGRLGKLLEGSSASTYRIYKNRTLGMPMTLTAIAKHR